MESHNHPSTSNLFAARRFEKTSAGCLYAMWRAPHCGNEFTVPYDPSHHKIPLSTGAHGASLQAPAVTEIAFACRSGGEVRLFRP
jgi:hypothetical protein